MDKPSADAPAVSIDSLTKDFSIGLRGVKLRAVDNLTLHVREGEVFGLLGPNGSGKSTTLKLILGLLAATRGQCSIFGIPARRVESRRDVGFLPEAPYFYRYLSGRELVCFYAKICGVPRSEIQERAMDAIRLVGMEEAARRRVGTYSKGMLQRIGLAQAIVHDPRLIILDEPTAGVDPIGSASIAELIRELKERGKTILLCSHLLAQVEGICDRIAIMNRGKLILEGAVDHLLEREGMRQINVEGLSEPALEEVRQALARHGAKLREVSSPRIGLDELFLREVRREGVSDRGDVPDATLSRDGRSPSSNEKEDK